MRVALAAHGGIAQRFGETSRSVSGGLYSKRAAHANR